MIHVTPSAGSSTITGSAKDRRPIRWRAIRSRTGSKPSWPRAAGRNSFLEATRDWDSRDFYVSRLSNILGRPGWLDEWITARPRSPLPDGANLVTSIEARIPPGLIVSIDSPGPIRQKREPAVAAAGRPAAAAGRPAAAAGRRATAAGRPRSNS